MENEFNRTSTDSPPSTYTRYSGSNPHSPPPRSLLDSPAESPISSIQSSLSGFSPRQDDAPSPLHGISPRKDDAPSPLHGEEDAPPVAVPVANRYVRSEPKIVTKSDPGVGDGFIGGTVEEGHEDGTGKRFRPPESIPNREAALKKAALGFRAFGFMFCLVSLSVISADKNQGWAVDSFYRYKEFSHRKLCGPAPAPMLSYLLLSASSSAAIRVDDWESNWGADKFPEMARASVRMSFMAFVALACNSIISGYSLYTSRSM